MTRYWLWDESNVTPSEVYDVEYETPPPDATILVPESAVEEARREERERIAQWLEHHTWLGYSWAYRVRAMEYINYPNQTEEGDECH